MVHRESRYNVLFVPLQRLMLWQQIQQYRQLITSVGGGSGRRAMDLELHLNAFRDKLVCELTENIELLKRIFYSSLSCKLTITLSTEMFVGPRLVGANQLNAIRANWQVMREGAAGSM